MTYTVVVLLFNSAVHLQKTIIQYNNYCIPISTIDFLKIMNIVNFCFCIVGCILCNYYNTLHDYFQSLFYGLFQLNEVICNLIVATAFVLHINILRNRIQNFIKAKIKDDSNTTNDSNSNHSNSRNSSSNSSNNSNLLSTKSALERKQLQLICILIACGIAFICRIIILALKALYHRSLSPNEDFEKYSVFWFSLSDFIPRGISVLSFFLLLKQPTMRKTNKNNIDNDNDDINYRKSNSYLSRNFDSTDDFEFQNDISGHTRNPLTIDDSIVDDIMDTIHINNNDDTDTIDGGSSRIDITARFSDITNDNVI